MNKNNYLIIGSSAAGIAAAAKLREFDPAGSITCLTAESVMPYNRCLLADVLAEKKTAAGIAFKTEALAAEKNITVALNQFVDQIDLSNQRVLTQQGSSFAYDKLLIATGRSGWIPKLPGSELTGVMSFYGLSDVTAITGFIKSQKVQHVLVVGAGLSGLECADALKSFVKTITVVEQASKILPQQLSNNGSDFLISLAKQNNVSIRTNTSVIELAGTTQVQQAVLSDGKKLAAELVIFAIGGKTNSWFAQKAGISLFNNAIDVSNSQQTSNEHVFAAGDVATIIDQISKAKTQSCLWPDAVKQGMVAASNMAGIEKTYDGSVLVTSSTIFGTTFVTAGPIARPPATLKMLVKQDATFYHALLIDQENILRGFCLLGNVDNIGSLRKKLLAQEPLF
jgi:nitrite reductase (NADH) large subunit